MLVAGLAGADLNAGLVSALYFVHDARRWPVFSVPAMSYPEGASVLIADGLPIGALIAKATFRTTGAFFNHFAAWMVAAFALQGVFAVRLAWAAGLRRPWPLAAVVSLTMFAYVLASRSMRTARMGQFLIVWALALYATTWRTGALRWRERAALAVAGQGRPSPMGLCAPGGPRWCPRCRRVRGGLRRPGRVAPVSALGDVGYAQYSWDVASWVTPHPRSLFGAIASGVTRDATGGQYEGDAYLGIGPMLLAIVALCTRPRLMFDTARARAHARTWSS